MGASHSNGETTIMELTSLHFHVGKEDGGPCVILLQPRNWQLRVIFSFRRR